MKKSVSIIIADAQYLTRKGLIQIISENENLNVIAEAATEDELLESVMVHNPDIVILDYDQPGHFSTNSIDLVKKHSPFSGILVISSDSSRSNIYDVVENGINSFITKQCDDKEILDAIQATAKKEKFFCHKILETILEKSFGPSEDPCKATPLTPREIEIVRLIATGKVAREISEELHISTHTIYTHRKNIMRKLQLSSPVELVMYAINAGLVVPSSAI